MFEIDLLQLIGNRKDIILHILCTTLHKYIVLIMTTNLMCLPEVFTPCNLFHEVYSEWLGYVMYRHSERLRSIM